MAERWLKFYAEFWSDPKIHRLHPYSRLVFLRLWFLCLDGGGDSWKAAMPDTVVEDLCMLTDIPGDDVHYNDGTSVADVIEGDLTLMVKMGMISIDEDEGRITLLNFAARQPRYARTGMPSDHPDAVAARKRKSRGVTNGHEMSRRGEEKRGEEKRGETTLSRKGATECPDCKWILHHLNQRRAQAGFKAGYGITKTNTKHTHPRHKQHSVDDCLSVIDWCWVQWKDRPDMRKYLRPATIFAASKFAERLEDLKAGAADTLTHRKQVM